MVRSIHPKHQDTVNAFLKADALYQLVRAGDETCKGVDKQRAYERAEALYDLLPKRERQNLWKHKWKTGF